MAAPDIPSKANGQTLTLPGHRPCSASQPATRADPRLKSLQEVRRGTRCSRSLHWTLVGMPICPSQYAIAFRLLARAQLASVFCLSGLSDALHEITRRAGGGC